MKKTVCFFAFVLHLLTQKASAQASTYSLTSPDKKIKLHFTLSDGRAFYSVDFAGSEVLSHSKLGLVRDDADLSKELHLVSRHLFPQ